MCCDQLLQVSRCARIQILSQKMQQPHTDSNNVSRSHAVTISGMQLSSEGSAAAPVATTTTTALTETDLQLSEILLELQQSFSSLRHAPKQIVPQRSSSVPFPLYRDVLHIIFRYLTLNELLVAIRLSKQWQQAFLSAPSLGITLKVAAKVLLYMPSHASIRRHISRCTNLKEAIEISQINFAASNNPRFLLTQFAADLPNLTDLEIPALIPDPLTGLTVPTWSYPLSFPPSLRCLKVAVNTGKWCEQHFPIIASIPHLQQFTLVVEQAPHRSPALLNEIDFAPLLLLNSHTLDSVHIQLQSNDPLNKSANMRTQLANQSLAQFVRRFAIKELSLPAATSNSFYAEVLLPPKDNSPFSLSDTLTSLDLEKPQLDRLLLDTLIHYPNLKRLSLSSIELNENKVKLLAKLPKVTEVEIILPPFSYHQTSTDKTVTAFQYLPNLLKLRVERLPLSVKQLDDCLSFLPHLTDLELDGNKEVSFAPMSRYGLPQRLKRLVLTNFSVPYEDLVNYILPMHQLETLHLIEVCREATPPAWVEEQAKASLPKLRDWKYVAHPYEERKKQTVRIVDSNPKGSSWKPFQPFVEDVFFTGNGIAIDIRHVYLSISAMLEYEHTSFEELRIEDAEIAIAATTTNSTNK